MVVRDDTRALKVLELTGGELIDHVVPVAAALFAEKGYARATVDELAHRVKIAKPTLYAHGCTKAAVLEAVFDRLMQNSRQLVADAKAEEGAIAQIYSLIRAWTFSAAANHSTYWKVWYSEADELGPEATDRVRRFSKSTFNEIRDVVVEGQRTGQIIGSADPTVATYNLLAIVNWTPTWYRESGRLNLEQIAESHYQMFAGGLFVLQPPIPRLRAIPEVR